MKRLYRILGRIISRYKVATRAIFLMIAALFVATTVTSVAPSSFPRNTILRIEKNMTVSEVAELLKNSNIIKSKLLYKIYVIVLHDGKGVQAGSYLFDAPQSALRIAYRTSYGVKNVQKIKLTIVEGKNSKELAKLLKRDIPGFKSEEFEVLAKKYEGYLFPETYFIEPDVTPGELVKMMRDQFDAAIEPLKPALATSTRSIEDIIIMASILEKEAGNDVDRQKISGILWKRLDRGMALQVDVPFYYILDKNGQGITLDDLAIKSPYNTYLNKGLPPTPIANPSLASIKAALYPVSSPYYFYLADKDGVTHYAKTHDEHVVNKQKYLK